jgi:hypothetical protein
VLQISQMLLGDGILHLLHLACCTFYHYCDNKNPLMHVSCRCRLAFVSQKEQLKICQRRCLPCRFVLTSSVLADVFVQLIFLYHSSFHPEGILREYTLCKGTEDKLGKMKLLLSCRGCGSCNKEKRHH